ncbi:hypothetical protein M8C21_033905 [Ambrosia artemisiifolia]|uniref:RING-type E3 ubiquitin transferase n=1 Tax=Ambrosia artemisiifolia TaxID=4212 RepID=A0AAD5CVC3_AMBAR|nr:hypothetical protein M8C21_033905 [Ambrosia artemisiifolia]
MAAFAGVLCGSAAAVCYLIRLSREEAAEYYKSVAQVNQLKDLGELLKTANKVLVKVSGNVSSDTPINCKLSGLRGVIVEEKAYQNFLMQNDGGKRIQDETLMLSTNREVPWYLDDGSTRVHIVGAYNSADLLKVTCEAYEGPGQSCVCGTCDCVQSPKIFGVRRIERVLPTDTQLSVVGEVWCFYTVEKDHSLLIYFYTIYSRDGKMDRLGQLLA